MPSATLPQETSRSPCARFAKKLAHVADSFPNKLQRAGKFLGSLFHPLGNLVGRKPTTALDFLGIQFEGTFRFTAINPDMFLVGLGTGGHFEKSCQGGVQLQSKLLTQLP